MTMQTHGTPQTSTYRHIPAGTVRQLIDAYLSDPTDYTDVT